MTTLDKLYRDAPRQKSPASVDRQILQHAQQHAERREPRHRARPGWIPMATSAAVACLALLLVFRPGLEQPSYSPPTGNESGLTDRLDGAQSRASTAATPVAEEAAAPAVDDMAEELSERAMRDQHAAETAMQRSMKSRTERQLQQQLSQLASTTELELAPLDATADFNSAQRPAAPASRPSDNVAERERPVAQLADTAPSSAPDVISKSRAWLAAQPPGAYTIQLAVSRDLQRLMQDIAGTSLDNSRIYFIAVPLREDTGYAALFGSWNEISAAYNAAAEVTQFEPWVRQFSELQ